MSDREQQRTQRAQLEVFPLRVIAAVILAAVVGVAYNIGGIEVVLAVGGALLVGVASWALHRTGLFPAGGL